MLKDKQTYRIHHLSLWLIINHQARLKFVCIQHFSNSIWWVDTMLKCLSPLLIANNIVFMRETFHPYFKEFLYLQLVCTELAHAELTIIVGWRLQQHRFWHNIEINTFRIDTVVQLYWHKIQKRTSCRQVYLIKKKHMISDSPHSGEIQFLNVAH